MSARDVEAGDYLEGRIGEFARRIVERQFGERPDLAERYGAKGSERCLEDAVYNLANLAHAMSAESPLLFAHYVSWLAGLLEALGVPSSDLTGFLDITRAVLQEELPPELNAPVTEYIRAGRDAAGLSDAASRSFLNPDAPLADLAREYLEALLAADRGRAVRLVLDAVEAGQPVRWIYLHVFQPVQYEIGRLWQLNRISVGQEHFCTAVTQLAISQLYQHIFTSGPREPRLVATCVGGELHELGARMVADFFEMAGWDTFYLGANTPVESVVREVQASQAEVLAVSATMVYHLRGVARLIERVRDACPGVCILAGGYPFKIDGALWRRMGADGSAPDAETAVEVAGRLLSESRG